MTKTRLSKRRIKKSPKRRGLWLFFALCFLLFVLGYFLFVFQKPFFAKDRNLSIAVVNQDGSVDVMVVNPIAETITTITIPGNTEVVAARQLGTWRIKSIWKLGEQEKLSGQLLVETITKTFNFPTEAWTDGRKTNLTVLDKVRLEFFTRAVKAASKNNINLGQTGALVQTKLVDGEVGYKLTGKTPPSILAIFGETNISQEGFLVTIEDATGVAGVARQVGKIIEVLGAKVAVISESKEDVEGCVVVGP